MEDPAPTARHAVGAQEIARLAFEQEQPIWPPTDGTDTTAPHLDVLLPGWSMAMASAMDSDDFGTPPPLHGELNAHHREARDQGHLGRGQQGSAVPDDYEIAVDYMDMPTTGTSGPEATDARSGLELSREPSRGHGRQGS